MWCVNGNLLQWLRNSLMLKADTTLELWALKVSFTVNYNQVNQILLHTCLMLYGHALIDMHWHTHANTRHHLDDLLTTVPLFGWYPGIYISSDDWTWRLVVGKQCTMGNYLHCRPMYCLVEQPTRGTAWSQSQVIKHSCLVSGPRGLDTDKQCTI